MKMKKRFLSILLSLVMVLGLMPGMNMMALASPPENMGHDISAGDITDNNGYILYVGSTQVTSANAGNIDGNNKASYNAESKTLTLNNYTNNGDNVYKWDTAQGAPAGTFLYSAPIYANQDLTINISGNSSVKGSSNAGQSLNFGVYVEGNLTITGSGTLDVQSGNQGNAIIGKNNVTINGGTVKAMGDSDGIYAKNNVDIIGATVEATSKYASGICASEGNVTIENSSVTAADTEDSYGGTAGILAKGEVGARTCHRKQL